MILTGVRPYREYKDNKPLDKVLGYKYTVVLPSRAYEQLDVKVPGSKMLDVVSGESFSVVFSNLQVRPYTDFKRNTIAYTAQAESVRRADSKH